MTDEAGALDELRARITELEVRNAYQDDLLGRLDEVVREFAARTEVAEEKLRELEKRIKVAEVGDAEIGPHDEKPPHY